MGFPKQLQPILVPFGTVVAKPEYLRKITPLHAIGDIHQGCEEVSSRELYSKGGRELIYIFIYVRRPYTILQKPHAARWAARPGGTLTSRRP